MVIELVCEEADIDVVGEDSIVMLSNVDADTLNVEEVYELIDEDAYLEYVGVKAKLERLALLDADIGEE